MKNTTPFMPQTIGEGESRALGGVFMPIFDQTGGELAT